MFSVERESLVDYELEVDNGKLTRSSEFERLTFRVLLFALFIAIQKENQDCSQYDSDLVQVTTK